MNFGWLTRFFEQRAGRGTGDSGLNSYITDVGNYLSTGGQASVGQTAAVEFALGLVGRAFMLARPKPAMPALTPLTLSMMARQTVALGNAVYRIGINPRTGTPRLNPVAAYELAGGWSPDSWMV